MKATRFLGNLYYLTDELPPKYGYIKMVAKALNDSSLLSSSGKRYTDQIVSNVTRGMHTDSNVKRELQLVVATYINTLPAEKRKEAKARILATSGERLPRVGNKEESQALEAA